ncbi:uncharacterized protein LOC127803312 [Diospyros lotus]|uniref:uncharacterized protein LOC127803312 n=1 Tax=Diospyros lotus TaxID=55363 RepID=UPI0022545FED|nr:uncharacterized protein LOC127803312 [Diospyros lotus]
MTCSLNIILRRKMAGEGILPQETEESRRRECAEHRKKLGERHRNSDSGSKIREVGFRIAFYEAVREGELNKVKELLEIDSSVLGTRFTAFEANALQVAVVAGQKEIFLELMKKVDDHGILKQKNTYGDTILTLAVAEGSIKIVKKLVHTCVELVDIPNKNGDLPVTLAALSGKKEIVSFLLDLTPMYESNPSYGDIEGVVVTNSTQSSVNDDEFKALKVSMTTQVFGRDERNYSFKLVNEDKDEAYKPAYQSEYHSFRLFKACISSQLYDLAYEVFELSPILCIKEMVKENGKTIYPLARVFMKQPRRKRFVDWCYEF